MQTMYAVVGGMTRHFNMPAAKKYVMPGIRWGRFDELLTPAYWCGQAWQHDQFGTYHQVRLGHNLVEEVVACLLGGFGMKAEMGLLAFSRLRQRQLLERGSDYNLLEEALSEPFIVAGRPRRYRFPRQKARYLAAALKALANFEEPAGDVCFRNRLCELPGIGPKTASWIVRNYRESNAIAIIDVHIVKAGRSMGLFRWNEEPSRDYYTMEEKFINFASAISSPVSRLDNLIWNQMRWFSPAIRS